MVAICFRFPGGRYHANPWGRHVNEADVEWPPSPWRILRALIATWHRKADETHFPEPLLEALIHKLSQELPVYRLPPAIRSHSRHYMPARKGRQDQNVLIFDAFVRLGPEERLVAGWPGVKLDEEEFELLESLARDMGFLGRAESWVECEVFTEIPDDANCRPSELSVDTQTGEALEPVQLITPVSQENYARRRAKWIAEYGLEGKKLNRRQKQIVETLPNSLLGALRMDTGEMQRAGWSCPPGGRFVTYQRPYECFRPQPRPRTVREKTSQRVTTVRLALSGATLPKFEDAVRIGELVRLAAMDKADRLNGSNGIPPVLSGHDLPPDNRHGHAFYLPEDADRDGHIEHVLVHAETGLSGLALRALDRITRIWEKGGAEWQVIVEHYGAAQEFAAVAYLGRSRRWLSATPYLHPWFAKKNFTAEDQIRRECRERRLPEPEMKRLNAIEVVRDGRLRRPVHFHRFRSRRGLTQPDTRGSFWELTFPEPVSGPLALGFGCHYGLGMFTRCSD